MFIENKYKTWYDGIIQKAILDNRKKGYGIYYENHHIIPDALGGNNDKSNMILLTAREHFICHLLLTKFTNGPAKRKMLHAVGMFNQTSKLQERKFSSWEYKKIRESLSKSRKGVKRDPAIGKKISAGLKGNIPWNKGKKVGPHSDESNRKRSNTLKGVTDIEKYGEEEAKERSLKLSESRKGHNYGMKGKSHSDETKKKMSESQRGERGPQKRIDKCPYCDSEQVTGRHVKFCKVKVEKIKWS